MIEFVSRNAKFDFLFALVNFINNFIYYIIFASLRDISLRDIFNIINIIIYYYYYCLLLAIAEKLHIFKMHFYNFYRKNLVSWIHTYIYHFLFFSLRILNLYLLIKILHTN